MDCAATRNDCSSCPGRVICHCLQVTEEAVLVALETLALRTVRDVRRATGAGDGCTACHKRLEYYLQTHLDQSSSAGLICSVR
jgi:NAD(P)H-nitrite reductase large subunit